MARPIGAPTLNHAKKKGKKERKLRKNGEPVKRRDKRAWLRQMKRLQKTTHTIFAGAAVDRIINDILKTMPAADGSGPCSMQPKARRALHAAAESKLHDIFVDANVIATQCAHLQGPSKAIFKTAVTIGHKDVDVSAL